MPPEIINEAVKTSSEPATSSGTSRKIPANRGENAKISRTKEAANPIIRLVAPVAPDTPTKLGPMLIPVTPRQPPMILDNPSARTPLRILLVSGRCQAALLIRWQVVITPTARSAAATPAALRAVGVITTRSEEHTSELQSPDH